MGSGRPAGIPDGSEGHGRRLSSWTLRTAARRLFRPSLASMFRGGGPDGVQGHDELAGDVGAATKIEIEHRGWERLGSKGAEARNRNVAGWGGLLPHYAAACAGTGENPLERPQPTGRGRRTDVQQRSPS